MKSKGDIKLVVNGKEVYHRKWYFYGDTIRIINEWTKRVKRRAENPNNIIYIEITKNGNHNETTQTVDGLRTSTDQIDEAHDPG